MNIKLGYMFLLLVCCIGCTCSKSDSKKLSESQNQTNLSVHFKYDSPVGGYLVEGIFYPFTEVSETGQIEVTFRSLETGEVLVYTNVGQNDGDTDSPAKFSGYNIDKIVFSDGFNSWREVDSLEFTYNTTKEPYPDSPLLYAAEFQFYDIDKDGVEELLVNQWDRHRGGNYYDVYAITAAGLKEKSLSGLKAIDNSTITR